MLKNLSIISGLLLLLGCFSCNQLADTFKDTFKEKTDDKREDAPSSNSTTVTSSVVIESHVSSDTIRSTSTYRYPGTARSAEATRSSGSTGTSGTTATGGASGPSRSTARKAAFLMDEAGLKAAQASLRALPAYAGKKMYLYNDIHAYDDGRINLQLRHPDNPEYVDAYHFRNGRWTGPEPVQLSIRDKVEQKMVPLDDVDFASMARVCKNIAEKSATIEGAKVPTHVYGIVQEKRMIWYPASISGSRERYAISFNPDGSVKKFFRE
ncbi:hypothetical protein HF324_23135 [Chitinophaga oryzae]|uniref:PepSY domain-containing protein n=1 Tax=Chitinophaga oryzae TaxID=2725414 RepID=A0AAE6ZIX7_9BACT|nr:hypothetical protein [Chitinophaga oryzae]QJB34044.1 hypothetical protein HF329_23240 [Chitinophaga oryzae]QJB40571.1 hypothetical protein HF324_23135 [Chitinophaga oryzae]